MRRKHRPKVSRRTDYLLCKTDISNGGKKGIVMTMQENRQETGPEKEEQPKVQLRQNVLQDEDADEKYEKESAERDRTDIKRFIISFLIIVIWVCVPMCLNMAGIFSKLVMTLFYIPLGILLAVLYTRTR